MPATAVEDLVIRAQAYAKMISKAWDPKLQTIIEFCASHLEAFPTRRGRKKLESINEIDDRFLEAYVTRYYRERDGVVLLRPVATKPDPAVDEVLKAFKRVKNEDLSSIANSHRLSMQAENIVGKLLERYVAGYLESRGWIWCCGETMRSVDFIKLAGQDVLLMQIKNRDNSENSSSSAIRAGTSISKWYRINSRTGRTRWESLPDNEAGVCSEAGFYAFVEKEAERGVPVQEIPDDEPEQ
jgi:hypothetical protein